MSHAAHVRPQHFRNADSAVFVLIVFENSNPGTADGKTAAIKSMHKSGFSLGFAALIPYSSPAGLKVFEIAAGTDFAIAIL